MARVHIYADESRTQGHAYMLIGGLWVPATTETHLVADIAELRRERSLRAELKWTKVSRTKLPAYRGFVDVFFRHPSAHFKCIIVNVTRLDHRTFSRGDEELGFYKFYFQLISRKLDLGDHYLLFTDERSNRKATRLGTLKLCVNRWWARWRGMPGAEPLRSIQPRDSKEVDLIQLCDVLLGAVGYVWNSRKGSPAKLELIRHVETRLGRPLSQPTPPNETKFNIWLWRPSTESEMRQEKKRPGP